jgi:hypothetical protein
MEAQPVDIEDIALVSLLGRKRMTGKFFARERTPEESLEHVPDSVRLFCLDPTYGTTVEENESVSRMAGKRCPVAAEAEVLC